uniref:RRM domain-containing protein n=1 Tax=Octopus bimaculoides TaxID=37653 RepID=A0A0L8H7Q9_OCTBM
MVSTYFRDNPEPSRCLGVFGLSLYTQERDLREVFTRYGPVEDVQVVYDRQSGRSRGFAFVYFRATHNAMEAKDRCNGIEVDGRRIRVDYSITERAHTPTPGIYLGKPTSSLLRCFVLCDEPTVKSSSSINVHNYGVVNICACEEIPNNSKAEMHLPQFIISFPL